MALPASPCNSVTMRLVILVACNGAAEIGLPVGSVAGGAHQPSHCAKGTATAPLLSFHILFHALQKEALGPWNKNNIAYIAMQYVKGYFMFYINCHVISLF